MCDFRLQWRQTPILLFYQNITGADSLGKGLSTLTIFRYWSCVSKNINIRGHQNDHWGSFWEQKYTGAKVVHSFLCSFFLASQFQEFWGITSKFLQKKGIASHIPFFPRVTFQEFLFAGTMFLQKQVAFTPLPPKCNNSTACRPKMSKRWHAQQHNLQQKNSVAALVSHSSYLLPFPPCQILQLAGLPLIAPSHPSCMVGCCVIARWPPSASQPAPLLLAAPSVCWLPHGIPRDVCCLGLPPPLIKPLHIFALLHPPLVWLVVASHCPVPWLPPPLLLCCCAPLGVWRTMTMQLPP